MMMLVIHVAFSGKRRDYVRLSHLERRGILWEHRCGMARCRLLRS